MGDCTVGASMRRCMHGSMFPHAQTLNEVDRFHTATSTDSQCQSSQTSPKSGNLLQHLREAKRPMKKGDFASARSSAILATPKEGISKLSGPRCFKKLDNLDCGRSHVSEIKLKRTDTTLEVG